MTEFTENKEVSRESDWTSFTHPGMRLACRLAVWLTVFAILYVLRSFFLLIFLTFVFAYIQTSGVERLAPRIKNRTVRVVLVAAAFLGLIVAIGNFLVPRVRVQAETFVMRLPQYLQNADASLASGADRYPFIARLFPNITVQKESASKWTFETSTTAGILKDMLGDEDKGDGSPVRMGHLMETVREIFAKILSSISAFFLSLIFSFLIVLDLPALTASAMRLKHTRLRLAYDEVAPTAVSFGAVLGRAFEAQAVIALLNTVLTAIGVWLLGLGDNIAFFSLIVFLCSFIPVAGVFMSSVPICLLALQESGFGLMIIAILLICAIHFVETYILNPKIYGHHLRMNPVLVLIILTIGGKLFGVWGLILGVPICTYIFGHAIRYKPAEV